MGAWESWVWAVGAVEMLDSKEKWTYMSDHASDSAANFSR